MLNLHLLNNHKEFPVTDKVSFCSFQYMYEFLDALLTCQTAPEEVSEKQKVTFVVVFLKTTFNLTWVCKWQQEHCKTTQDRIHLYLEETAHLTFEVPFWLIWSKSPKDYMWDLNQIFLFILRLYRYILLSLLLYSDE